MKAIVCTKYGSPDVLKLQEVEKPVPKDNEILIRVHAATVTAADCTFRRGDQFFARLYTGLVKPKNRIPGTELAGIIEDVGKNVKLFKTGDQVFGASTYNFGANAEYKCLPEEALLALKPANINYSEAAAACDGALTALNFLRDQANIQNGQKILINGASGSVGTFAVQLAKYFGTEVTAVCSTANLEMVTSLGADNVIDYTKVDFTKTGQTWDIIFDAVGKSSYPRCKRSLKHNGIYISPVLGVPLLFQMLWTSMMGSKKAIFASTGLRPVPELLNLLNDLIKLIENGKLKAVIDRIYPMDQIVEAHKYVEKGHKRGNVVITVHHNPEP